jgi:hypothetical protein
MRWIPDWENLKKNKEPSKSPENPPLPIVPCDRSPAGTGTAKGFYWVGHGAA